MVRLPLVDPFRGPAEPDADEGVYSADGVFNELVALLPAGVTSTRSSSSKSLETPFDFDEVSGLVYNFHSPSGSIDT